MEVEYLNDAGRKRKKGANDDVAAGRAEDVSCSANCRDVGAR